MYGHTGSGVLRGFFYRIQCVSFPTFICIVCVDAGESASELLKRDATAVFQVNIGLYCNQVWKAVLEFNALALALALGLFS